MANEDLSRLKIEKSESTYSPLRRRKLGYMVGAIFFILLMGFLYVKGVLTPAVEVEVASVTQLYPSQTFTLLNASGYVVAQRKAAVASKVTGRLVSLSVEEGSKVKAGQVIARFENDDVKAARDQSEANLNAARHNLEQAKAELNDAAISFNRNKDLVSQGFISKAEHDASEARYKKAVAAAAADEAAIKASVAALQGANVALEYTLIRAPFDAVVLTKNADIGDIVTPIGSAANAKAAVVTIADMDSLQVEVDVSETSITTIRVGQPCDIQLDALADMRFRGEVHAIVPTVDRSKATVLVKVRFLDKDSRMLPDMSAKVSFLSRNLKPEELKPRIAVSQAALINRGNQNAVFLLRGNHVQQTSLQLGKKLGDMMEVTEGLKPGDRVVINPPKGLKDGSKIKIAER